MPARDSREVPGAARHGLLDDAPKSWPTRYLVAHIDGGSRGNPGPAGYGVMVQDGERQPVAELSEYLGVQTNNFAEYSGLLAALAYALSHGYKALKVFSDSELMVKQIKGQYKVSHPALKELHAQARRKIGELEAFEISHVFREKNRDADRLANLAMNRGTKSSPDGGAASNPATNTGFTREATGVVRNGVVEFLGAPLPDGTFVRVRVAKP
jgi:ribonuclease HI